MTTQTPPPETEARQASIMLWFALITVPVACIIITAFTVLIIQRGALGDEANAPVPYRVDARPLPTVGALGEMFTTPLGPFLRRALGGSFEGFSAAYTGDAGQVQVRGTRAVSLQAALFFVRQTSQRYGFASEGERIRDGDPRFSFYYTRTRDAVVFAWSHDRWAFEIVASSQAALDAFMAAFRY